MNGRPLLWMGIGALILQACYMVAQPGAITNFLTGGDERLADTIRRAAETWARHGLEIANYVTVNDGRAGLPVRFAPYHEIRAGCPDATAINLSGCTHWAMGDWLEMLIIEDFAERPADLDYMVLHELIHALVPKAPHHSGPGIFTASRTVDTITTADLRHLARYTTVQSRDIST